MALKVYVDSTLTRQWRAQNFGICCNENNAHYVALLRYCALRPARLPLLHSTKLHPCSCMCACLHPSSKAFPLVSNPYWSTELSIFSFICTSLAPWVRPCLPYALQPLTIAHAMQSQKRSHACSL